MVKHGPTSGRHVEPYRTVVVVISKPNVLTNEFRAAVSKVRPPQLAASSFNLETDARPVLGHAMYEGVMWGRSGGEFSCRPDPVLVVAALIVPDIPPLPVPLAAVPDPVPVHVSILLNESFGN